MKNPAGARRVPVAAEIAALDSLATPSYADCFAITPETVTAARSAEVWMRAARPTSRTVPEAVIPTTELTSGCNPSDDLCRRGTRWSCSTNTPQGGGPRGSAHSLRARVPPHDLSGQRTRQ